MGIVSGGFGLRLEKKEMWEKLGLQSDRQMDQLIDKALDIYDSEPSGALEATEMVIGLGSVPQPILFFFLMVGVRDLASARQLFGDGKFEEERYDGE